MANLDEAMEEVAERRQRNRQKKPYFVERPTETAECATVVAWTRACDFVFDDTIAARKWIRDNGDQGKYRIVALCDECEKKVETVTKTSLV
jgi:hypothetical protein